MNDPMTEQGKFAIVLPVFNVENYITECLHSILEQTYRNFAVVAVDDGSEDRSGDLLDEVARIDSRIQVIHQMNGGVSAARNCALNAVAKLKDVEFVCFIDADDRISPDYLARFSEALTKHAADYAVCSFQCFTRIGLSPAAGKIPDSRILSPDEIAAQFFNISLDTGTEIRPDSTSSLFLNNRCFHYEAVKGLRFRESLKACEDQDFLIRAIPKLKKGVVVPQTLFFYRRRLSSLSNQASVKGDDLRVYEVLYSQRDEFSRVIRMGIQAEYLIKLTQHLFTLLASDRDWRKQMDAYSHCLDVLKGTFEFPFSSSMKRKAAFIQSSFLFTKLWAKAREMSKQLRNRSRDLKFFP